jgi:aerobic C4-dicarboxylate transport protein
MNVDVSALDIKNLSAYTDGIKNHNSVEFLLNVIPASVVDAFAKGEILQVLLFSILFGFSLAAMKETGAEVVTFINKLATVLFGIVETIMKLAPIGAFGAMAFTIGKYGITSLAPLAKLMGSFYLTCLLFIFIVLGIIAKYAGFNIVRFIIYIKEELLIVLGTSSSESVLPSIITKLENLGCSKSVVGLVIPTGYSFNLDGTSIYLVMAAIFVAQATNTPLNLTQELTILGVLLLTSKGAAGVSGSGFVTLAATLSVLPSIPIAGLALILGIDRFMSEARALTNLIGNGVATVVAAKWENALDVQKMQSILKPISPQKNV